MRSAAGSSWIERTEDSNCPLVVALVRRVVSDPAATWMVPFAAGLVVGFFSAVTSAFFAVPVISLVGPLLVVGELVGVVLLMLRRAKKRSLALGLAVGLALGVPFLWFRLSIAIQDLWLHSVFG